jgi:general secretion pathway protein G
MIERLQAKRNEEGFTLIELLIVIIVLGILAAIVVFAVSGTKKDAISATCKTDQKSIELSAESVLAKKAGATALTDVTKADLSDATKGGLLKAFPTNANYTLDWVAGAVTVQAGNPLAATTCAALGS